MWGCCINMVLVRNGRIWGFGVKTLVFGSKPRKNTHLSARAAWHAAPPAPLPAPGTVPLTHFYLVFVWGFLDWHHIRNIKRGWLVNFGRIWRVLTMVKGLVSVTNLMNPIMGYMLICCICALYRCSKLIICELYKCVFTRIAVRWVH